MKLKNYNLENIKVAIFDFDDTLAIHKDKKSSKRRKEDEDVYLDYYLNAYKNPSIFYEEIEQCIKSEQLYNFIGRLRCKGIKMYCLSGMNFSFNLKAKQNFIDKYYGNDIEIISVSSQKLKIDGVKIFQRLNKCKLDEILFIDDREDVIELLKENGVNAILVSDIES